MVPESMRRGCVPEATVGRLPLYLRALTALHDQGITSISSEELASRGTTQIGDALVAAIAGR